MPVQGAFEMIRYRGRDGVKGQFFVINLCSQIMNAAGRAVSG
jgi:hypothetical protein